MNRIIGHERQQYYLETAFARGRLSHAYLFVGTEHIGKYTVALAFANMLQCEQGNGRFEGICGVCADCRMIAARVHPQVCVIDRTITKESGTQTRKEIPLEEIRELRKSLSLASAGSRSRVVIINEAEKLTQEAANAFLKLLEEPGAHTLFILVSSSAESVLPTLRSRSQVIRFTPVSEDMIRTYLTYQHISGSTADELTLLAGGRPGILMRLTAGKNVAAEERALLKELERFVGRPFEPEALILSQRLAGDEELRQRVIDYSVRIMRKRLLAIVAKGQYSAYNENIRQLDRIASLLETTNVNTRLAMDAFFITASIYILRS